MNRTPNPYREKLAKANGRTMLISNSCEIGWDEGYAASTRDHEQVIKELREALLNAGAMIYAIDGPEYADMAEKIEQLYKSTEQKPDVCFIIHEGADMVGEEWYFEDVIAYRGINSEGVEIEEWTRNAKPGDTWVGVVTGAGSYECEEFHVKCEAL